MRQVSAAFICGLIFSLGLGLAGMTSPDNVLAFLDITGTWDPRLAFVMAGALAVTVPAFPLILRRTRPLFEQRFDLPSGTTIDRPLLVGAILFGMGWGLAGYCPGPAIVSLMSGAPQAWLFVGSMLAGFALARR